MIPELILTKIKERLPDNIVYKPEGPNHARITKEHFEDWHAVIGNLAITTELKLTISGSTTQYDLKDPNFSIDNVVADIERVINSYVFDESLTMQWVK